MDFRGKLARFVLGTAVVAVALASAAPASAADRFAEVGPGGSNPSCPQADPCSIETAINSSVANDDVTLLGGLPPTPYDTSTPLVVPANVTVHGTPGARPVIETDVGDPGVQLTAGSVMRDVVVLFSGVNSPAVLLSGGGTLERVTGMATADSGSATGGCATFGEGAPVIRDSVCWHGDPDGANGGGVEARNMDPGAQTLILRNVTASTANARPGVFAVDTGTGSLTVNATNVIAHSATGADVGVFSEGFINLDHSNYDSEADLLPSPGLITDPGTGPPNENQTVPPSFVNAAAGDFRQTSLSIGTVDLGVAGMVNGVDLGTLDFQGETRSQDAGPDIGADELSPPPPPPPPPGPGAQPTAPTGERAAALKKCKRKKSKKARKKCRKRAQKLPP